MKKKHNIFRHLIIFFLVTIISFSWNITNYSLVPAASKASYKIINYQKVKRYKKLSAKYLYQLPQLTGNNATIQKINKSLRSDYRQSLEAKKNLFEFFETYKSSGSFYLKQGAQFLSTTKCTVAYNRNGYISFKFSNDWWAGGVHNGYEYGLTYRLRDGKKMGIQDVIYGRQRDAKKNIATAYARQVSSAQYNNVLNMKYSDFNFYLKPGKRLIVCFGPYPPGGGNGHLSIIMQSKLR